MELKVGDRVRIKNRRGYGWNSDGKMDKWMGKEVTIRKVYDANIVLIEEDVGERGSADGWAWRKEDFEPIDNKETLVIYRKGNETIGILKSNGEEIRRAVAKCRKDDTCIFQTGVELVTERIFDLGQSQPKAFDMKVVCVSSATPDFTLGKVYKVENGTIEGNEGTKYCYFRDLEDLNLQMESQFIKFVE